MFHKREVARRHESMRGLCAFSWFIFLLRYCDAAVDTVTTNQPIPDGKTIISSDGTFEMGFFSPDGTSKNRYLGIWYKKVTETTVVWIANRDAPLRDTDGVFKVTRDANLTLLDGSGSSLWSINGSRLLENPIAQLLDSGNLVVRDASDDDPRNYVWQSFDDPTDTILPGMKLGLDLVKKIDRHVRSPKSSSDPSGGGFTFLMDPSGFPQEFLLNGKDAVFRSGPWNGLRFSGSPGLKPNDLYTYEYVQTPEEIYYKFDLINSSLYSRLTLTSDGVLRRLNWNYNAKEWTVYLNAPADNCDRYGLCKGNGICDIDNSPVCSCLDKFVPRSPDNWVATDWSAGCMRRVSVVCRKGDGFLRYGNVKLPDTRNSWYNESMSLRECEKLCESNCSCMAYSNTNISGKGSGCLLWFGDLMDMIKFTKGGQDIYIRLDSSEIGSGSYKAKIVGITLPLLGGFWLILILVLRREIKKKKKQKRNDEQPSIEGTLMGNMSENFYTEDQSGDLELPFIDLQTVLKATNNLSFGNKLGQGGFGLVYKGTMIDGKEIAVKRLSEFSIQGLEEFKNEVRCIAKLQHRNLVKLLGCCIQEEEKMLVYEFMPNKSLDLFIFDHYRSRLLDWPKRTQIISGIARGLLYLHQDSRLTIIHRDLKAANILLDIDMKPKISDFGMARIFGGSETEANNTKRVVGTYGYMSPEYAVDGYFSTKSDVFSFGVLVLEIVSGMKNRGFSHPDHHHNLLGHAWLLYKEDRSQELIEKNLILESCHLFEVMRSIHVALLCVQKSPDDRPSMSSVVLQLASDGALPLPKEPGFFTERDFYFEQDDPSSSTNRQDSSADYSITILEGR